MVRTGYLYFTDVSVPKARKTRLVEVRSTKHGLLLGVIRWYSNWRQYVFMPAPETIFNPDCMNEILSKVSSMTRDHKQLLRERRGN